MAYGELRPAIDIIQMSGGQLKGSDMKVTVKQGSKNRMKSTKEVVRDVKKAGGRLKKKVTGK